jgi:biopolymer transport protein ExbD
MAMDVRRGEDHPLLDINLTPLIDVMLVLLTLLIIMLPLQTHMVKMGRARRFDSGDC